MPPKTAAAAAAPAAAGAAEEAGAGAAGKGCSGVVYKKVRNANPGVRVVGGRIYDSDNGKTCHQCRQKTIELKAPCGGAGRDATATKGRVCGVFWCEKCLFNRRRRSYGERVAEVLQQRNWVCPKCRGSCNCSFCRKKQGLEATGILSHLAKHTGFASVAQLLQSHPDAPPAQPGTPEEAAAAAAAASALPQAAAAAADELPPGFVASPAKAKPPSAKKGRSKEAAAPAPAAAWQQLQQAFAGKVPGAPPAAPRAKRPRASGGADADATAAAAAASTRQPTAVPDEQLPPRAAPLPQPAPLLRVAGGALPPATLVPTGQLLCVLELLTTFREALGLAPSAWQERGTQQPNPSPFNAPPTLLPDMLQELARAAPADAPGAFRATAVAASAMLTAIRSDWGRRKPVSASDWEAAMSEFLIWDSAGAPGPWALEVSLEEAAAAARAAACDGAGDSAHSGDDGDVDVDADADDEDEDDGAEDEEPKARGGVCWRAAAAGWFGGCSPAARVEALASLAAGAAACERLRSAAEAAASAAAECAKVRREAAAEARRAARLARQTQRDAAVRALLGGGAAAAAAAGGLTVEAQKALLARGAAAADAAGAPSAAAEAAAAAAAVEAGGDPRGPDGRVRVAPLGRDREGRAYWQLACCSQPDAAPGAPLPLLVSWLDDEGVERWAAHAAAAAPAVAEAMASNGEREGRLRAALLRRYAAAGDEGVEEEEQHGEAEPAAKKRAKAKAKAETKAAPPRQKPALAAAAAPTSKAAKGKR